MSDLYPPATFQFSVALAGEAEATAFQEVAVFQEVTGLESGLPPESVAEGVQNRFQHLLPKRPVHANLTLRRGRLETGGALATWCRATLEGSLGTPVETRALTVELQSGAGNPLARWRAGQAYPVMWTLAPFAAAPGTLEVETIAFAYATLRREL